MASKSHKSQQLQLPTDGINNFAIFNAKPNHMTCDYIYIQAIVRTDGKHG